MAPDWLRHEVEASPTDSVWVTGLFPHPADVLPSPAADKSQLLEAFNENMEAVSLSDVIFEDGQAVVDGSCTRPYISELARASWAAAMLGPNERILFTVRGPVMDPLPQTPQCAENVAIAVLSQL